MTIFDKIIAREIPAEIVFEDDRCLAFRDIMPQAPVHILVIPKRKILRLSDATEQNESILGHLLLVAAKVAEAEHLEGTGFRVVINNGFDGGETVPHLHIHLLGGRPLGWPPG